jgi:hypothetical protein
MQEAEIPTETWNMSTAMLEMLTNEPELANLEIIWTLVLNFESYGRMMMMMMMMAMICFL